MILHKINGYIQSIYLIEYPDKLLLLDGLCRADVAMVCDFISETLKRPLSDLTLVVVTHMHPDHAGGATQLRQLTGCSIAISNVDGDWYQGIDGFLMRWTDILLAHWVAKRMGKPKRRLWYPRKIKADIKLNDGDILPGFDEWQALFTQGHTDRDLSLHHLPSNKVYVADLMVTVKGRFISPFPVFYPNRYQASIERIKALNPQGVYLAHGGEVQLSEQDYQHLFAEMPKTPATHWRSVKAKFFQGVFGIKPNQ